MCSTGFADFLPFLCHVNVLSEMETVLQVYVQDLSASAYLLMKS
jgi:hypothetical protein